MKIKILASLAISIYILIQTNTSVSAYQGSTETEFGPIEITTKDNFSMNDSASVVIKNEGNLRQKAKRILYSLFNSKKIPTIDIKNQNGEIVKKTRIPFNKSQIKLANTIPGKYNVNLNNSKITSFNWGVLAINTNKSEYRLGETVDIHMAVLDPMGEMVCNAQLELAVQNKTTGKRESFSTEDTSIVVLPGCSSKELILDGDYMMHYQTSEIGNFELILKATTKYGEYTINDNFTVNQDLNHSVERITATRIYPALDYPVIFRVNLKQNYSGKISDFVPDEFKTKKISKNEVEKHLGISLNDYQFIETKSNKPEWKVNLEKNTDYYFGYYYDAPNLSPAFYNIGPLKIDKYLETRSWQIAVDSVDNCITIVGYTSNPFYDLENGTTGKIGPTLAVTPPTGMASGDVAIIFAHYRGSATLSMSETGGQSWTALTQATQSTTNTSRIFYAVYNGTWSADPSVTVTSGTATLSLSMHVYRGVDGSSPLDVTQTASGFSAPSTPFDVTITGITTNTNGALALAFWASQDDNQYQLRTDGTDGWEATGHSQIRNQGGSDTSLTMAYKYTPTAGATGDITVRQVTLGGDAGTRHILALKPATPNSAVCNPLYGYASNPFYDLENGTTGKIGPTLAVTPPTGMASGDVAIIFAHYRGSATLSMSETGGQSWTALTQATQSTTNTSRIFYAVYNGTWSADPSVTVTSGTATLTAAMYVFQGVNPSNIFDVAHSGSGYSAPSTPFDVTRTGITTNTDGALALAFWSSQDDNQWELRSGGSGWQNMRSASIRNQGGTDNSISAAFKWMPTAGSTGDVTNRQVDLGGDAGTTHIFALDYSNNPPDIPSLELPIDTHSAISLTPTLSLVSTDLEAEYLRYKIELCQNEAMTTNCQEFDQTASQTGWSGQDAQTGTAYDSGSVAHYTLQSNLAINTTYYWRAYAIDPGGSDTWSNTQTTPHSFTVTTPLSFQRKTFHDPVGDRYWRFSHDSGNILPEYSADGSTWNSTTTLPYNTNDFSVEYRSISGTEYVWLVATHLQNIVVRRGTLSSSSITWDSNVSIPLTGTWQDTYYYFPYLTLDTSHYLWVNATQINSAGSRFITTKLTDSYAAHQSLADWAWSTPISLGSTQSGQTTYGTITARSSRDMYSVFMSNDNLSGCRWNHSAQTWQNSSSQSCIGGGNDWLEGWGNRLELTVSNTNIDSNLTHFPLLLTLGSSVGTASDDVTAIFDELGSNSKKIALTKDDGLTQIYTEIETWDNSAEKAWLWVSSSDLTLSSSAPTTLYLYYDSTQADNTTYVGDTNSTPAEVVWDSNYLAVHHFGATSGTYYDSTSNNNDSTSVSVTSRTANSSCRVGNCPEFNGASNTIALTENNTLDLTNSLTIQATIDADGYGSSGGPTIVSKHWTTYEFYLDSPTTMHLYGDSAGIYADSSSSSFSFDIFQNLAVTYDNASVNFFTNSVAQGTDSYSGSFTTNDQSLYIGSDKDVDVVFDGHIDEVRISSTPRSVAWLKADHHSLTDNLVSWGDPETSPVGSTDAIATSLSGLSHTFSTLSDGSGNLHLLYLNASGHALYRNYTSSWQTAVTLDSNAGNAYPSLTHDTDNNALYAFWIRGEDIYYKMGSSPFGSGDWDSTPTSWQTSGVNRSLSSNYSGGEYHIFGQWLDNTNLQWALVNSNTPPNTPSLDLPADSATNQSLTPTLLTTTTDADSDFLRYKIELCENLGMTTNCQTFDQTSSQTGWSGQNAQTSTAYTSGTQATYTLQSPLTGLTTYYWRSYAIDPAGSNTWSGTQTPRSFTTQVATGDFNFKGLNFKGINLE